MYFHRAINSASSRLGMWQAGPTADAGWLGIGEMLDDIATFAPTGTYVTELTDNAVLPEGAEDIRGKIYDEPEYIFVLQRSDGYIEYFGVDWEYWEEG